jgi:signal transduction histidine kinase
MNQNLSEVCVLAVDDTPKNLEAIEALLTRPGLKVLCAGSGDEALELLLVNEVALALIDLNMPGMNGYELAEIMRGNSRTHAIPLIFITAGLNEAQATFRGYQAGAVDFLNKPFNPDILKSKVDVFVELFSQRKLLNLRLTDLQRALQEQQAAEQALLEAGRHKDEFLAVLAHELRNPLAPIRSALDIFGLRASGDQLLNQARQAATRQVEHMTQLVNDLMDTARISRGKISLQRGPCDLARIVSETAQDYRGTLQDAGIKVDLQIERPLVVDGDPTRLAQCIGNLLHNAGKFSPRGTTVTVRADTSLNSQGQPQAQVEVSDQGVGLPPELLEQVFSAFTQGRQEPSRSQGGLGLGLALVKALVELHGGQVRAHSAGPGQGARFTIVLPLLEETLLPRRVEAAPAATLPLKLLAVDDNRDYLQTLASSLRMLGHMVSTAEHGEQALEVARRLHPDVVLCDLGLPGALDGCDVARALRRDPAFARTRLVAVSGYGGDADRERALSAGFDHHFTKPVALKDFPLAPRDPEQARIH